MISGIAQDPFSDSLSILERPNKRPRNATEKVAQTCFQSDQSPPVGNPNLLLTKDIFLIVKDFLTPIAIARLSESCRTMKTLGDTYFLKQANTLGIYTQPEIRDALSNHALCFLENQQFRPVCFDSKTLRLITEYSGPVRGNIPEIATHSHPIFCFGVNEWLKMGIKLNDVPPLPDNLNEIVSRPCPFFPGRTIEDTHFLMLMPSAIIQYANQYPLNSQLERDYLLAYLNYAVSNSTALGSEWMLMTNMSVKNSELFSEQFQAITSAGYRLPIALEAALTIYCHSQLPFRRRIRKQRTNAMDIFCHETTLFFGQELRYFVRDLGGKELLIDTQNCNHNPSGLIAVRTLN